MKIDIEPLGYYSDVHGFLKDECDKDCYCPGGCNMTPLYSEEQMKQLINKMQTES